MTCVLCRFQGANGQQVEFKLKPQWTLPQQADLDDWDINPASIQLPEAEVLADATFIREQHLDGMLLISSAELAVTYSVYRYLQSQQPVDFLLQPLQTAGQLV